jgi:predicted dehydrogenase
VALSLPKSPILGANDAIRIGAIGLGSFVKIGGKGRKDVQDFNKLEGVQVTSLCDCDSDHLDYVVEQYKKQNLKAKAYGDFRRILDDPDIDAVSIVTPNHWHSLMTIMACQAGKDVFVQKPASHNIFEGRKMVEAMQKYNRIVQATHGPRNSGAIDESYDYIWAGKLGKIQCVYGINYRPRISIGKVSGPRPIPKSCDYDLWCGPAPTKPLVREYLHYDWHWDWSTGNGDLGNMGIHAMDGCRWAVRQNELPRRVLSIGGRLGYEDDGQTPNTMITLLDYEPIPIIFEVRGLPKNASYLNENWQKGANQKMDKFRGIRIGAVVVCEGGYLHKGIAYDNDGKQMKTFTRERVSTKQNFIDAVRSRKADSLFTDALEGHLSCGLVHMANISYQVGQSTPKEQIRDSVTGEKEMSDCYERLLSHLDANHLDLNKDPLILGPMLTLDPKVERFEGPGSDKANALISRDYRKPFIVPDSV